MNYLARSIGDEQFRDALELRSVEDAESLAEKPDAEACQEYLALARKLGSCKAAHALMDASRRITNTEDSE